jgi:hypothetical protein
MDLRAMRTLHGADWKTWPLDIALQGHRKRASPRAVSKLRADARDPQRSAVFRTRSRPVVRPDSIDIEHLTMRIPAGTGRPGGPAAAVVIEWSQSEGTAEDELPCDTRR